MMKYHYTSVELYEMIGYCDKLFSYRLYWKIALNTSKIVNNARRSKRRNWCMLPCCILSLSEVHFVIGSYTSLFNYILHFWRALTYFSSHMSSRGVIMWFRTEDIDVANN
jgi:hypothetical protein